jgi:hypothetical protein
MIISKEKYQETISIISDKAFKELYELIDSALEYSSGNESDQSEIIKKALNILIMPHEFVSSSLFLLDENDYFFKHSQTMPNDKKIGILNIFPLMIENGTIGNCIDNYNFTVLPEQTFDNVNSYLCVPLSTPDGAIGIIIIETNKPPQEIEKGLIKLIKLTINILKLKLNSFIISKKEEKTQLYIEQLASEKALRIIEQK